MSLHTYLYYITWSCGILLSLSACREKEANKIVNGPVTAPMTMQSVMDSTDIVLSRKAAIELCDIFKRKYLPLTPVMLHKGKQILADFVKNGGGDTIFISPLGNERQPNTKRTIYKIRTPLPLSSYYKQYYAWSHRNHQYLEINLFPFRRTFSKETLQNSLWAVKDGGIYFGQATVDLTTHKVIAFRLNGEG